ncbi:MAG: VIT1/CCC1 transporter family protein [Candidatus Pacearchaeota archaeon]
MIKKRTTSKTSSFGGAIVLGLNDALVELSGALVGLTFAISSSRLIATVGLITGFAAALSMAASEYLSAKEDKKSNPLRLSIYTGIAYIITVLILVSPYLFLANKYSATAVMGVLAVGIIAMYTKYDSRMHNESFKKKFFEMFAISASVAVISFVFGLLVRRLIA